MPSKWSPVRSSAQAAQADFRWCRVPAISVRPRPRSWKRNSRLADARDFALRNRVLLLRAASGVGIDVALAWIPFEERVVNRSTLYEYQQGVSLRTCSADDLIVMKAFAGRGKDWVDVENVIVRQSGKLDWESIFQEIDVLAEAKGEPEIVTELRKRREDFENT